MDLATLEAAAARELKKHGLDGWTFGLANTRRRLGVCKYRAKRIEISEAYARNNAPEGVIDTLLHEIAHAIAGPAAKHGPKWKEIAARLGATPRACDASPETIPTPGDWQATCSACSRIIHLYRRPRRLDGYRCKCKDHAPLIFEYKGDPAREVIMPKTARDLARWEGSCAGCGTIHLRLRKPEAGIWQCKCPHHCEITWQRRTPTG